MLPVSLASLVPAIPVWDQFRGSMEWALDNLANWTGSAGLAIMDTMRLIPNDVSTLAMGLAASMGQFLLSAGTPGKRYALPHSRVLMHQGSAGIGGSAVDIELQADDLRHTRDTVLRLIADDTGQERPDRAQGRVEEQEDGGRGRALLGEHQSLDRRDGRRQICGADDVRQCQQPYAQRAALDDERQRPAPKPR